MLVTLTLDYRTFTDKSHLHLHRAARACCVYVLFFGTVQMGARRWIPLRVFNLQPSEFAKVGVALVLAKFFGENRGAPRVDRPRDRRRAHRCCRSRSSRKEPDLGTAVTLLPVFLAVAYLAGMRMRILGVLVLCALSSRRRSRGSSRSRTIRRRASRRSSIRRRMRRAPATSRSRRASPSDRAA